MLKKSLNFKSAVLSGFSFLKQKSKFYFSLGSFLAFLFCPIGAWSVVWDIPLQGVNEIQVRARAAKLVLKQGSTSTSLKVSILGGREESWRQEVQNMDSGSSSAEWGGKTLKITGPEEGIGVEETILSLELPTNSVTSKFVFEEVRADLQGVSKVLISALKGKIIGRGTGREVKYFMQKGDIQSSKHNGDLEIESFGGKVVISEGQGPIKLKLFNGDLSLEKNIGDLSLESYSSSAKLIQHQGHVSLQWGKGRLLASDFMGRFEGTSLEGQLQLQVKPDSLVDLQAVRGKVSVRLPTSSGASLHLRSLSGELSLPGSMKPVREGRYRVLRTKLAGSQKGSVNLRSEEASLSISSL